jgi:hypothetical protein
VTNQSREDSDLEALLARKSDVSRAWRAIPTDEPSAAVDDAIRAAARQAVSAVPQASRSSFAVQWRVPLAVAAVLVVSASLTLLVSEEKQHLPGMTPQDLPRAAAPPHVEPDAAPAKRDEEAPQGGSSRALSDRAVPSEPTDKAVRAGKASGAVDSVANRVTAPAPEATAVTPEAAPVPDRPASVSESGAPARNDSSSLATDARGKVELKEVLPSARELPAQPSAQGAAPEALAKHKFEQEKAVPQPQEADSVMPAAPLARVPAQAQLHNRAAPAKQSPTEENLAPAAWIERILNLRREGKLKEAADSLEAFRRRYPDYPLPQELSAPR